MNTTLLVDGNWLLMSRLFAVKDRFNINNSDEDKLEGKNMLSDLMARSINIILNRFSTVIDDIVIVQDGGSWRKSIAKPSCYVEEYKGNRVKSEEMDWDYIFASLDDLVSAAESNNITTSKAIGIEGDDWIYHWSRKLNKEGRNCVIWSIDCDLKQLVQVDNGAFTAWYNEKPGLVLHKDLNDSVIDDIEFFMRADLSNPSLDALRAGSSIVTYIDPIDIVEDKIICGDRGDNIKPVVSVKKGEKTYGVTDKLWSTIKDDLCIDGFDDFVSKKERIISNILADKKFAGKAELYDDARDMFDYNIQLVFLHDSVYPDEVKDLFESVEHKKCDINYIRGNYKVLVKNDPSQKSVEDIFDGIF